MMKRELAADIVEPAASERHRGGIGAYPSDLGSLALRQPQHAERVVDPDDPRCRRRRAICDQLVSGATRNVEQSEFASVVALAKKCRQFGVRSFRSIGMVVVKFRDRIVVKAL